jgi:hypothetical protein
MVRTLVAWQENAFQNIPIFRMILYILNYMKANNAIIKFSIDIYFISILRLVRVKQVVLSTLIP